MEETNDLCAHAYACPDRSEHPCEYDELQSTVGVVRTESLWLWRFHAINHLVSTPQGMRWACAVFLGEDCQEKAGREPITLHEFGVEHGVVPNLKGLVFALAFR